MRLPALHKKGIFTVSLIVLTESITFSNAVHFWSNWSGRYGNRRSNFQQNGDGTSSTTGTGTGTPGTILLQSNFEQRNSQIQECAADKSDKCINMNMNTLTLALTSDENGKASAPHFHPRKLTRKANSKTTTTCTSTFYDCCNQHAPSCIALDIRGGHGSNSFTSATAETAAKTAETILTAASGASANLTPYNLPLNLWKVIFQIFLTALNVACWLIPLRAKKITENKLAMGLANAFSGGVFLSLAFGHLIPECVHGFEGMNESLPYMIVLGGYLLIFFVEKVAFDAHGLMHAADHQGETKEVQTNVNSNGEATSNGEANATATANTGRSAVILLGALAVHSILEMTALGLADSFGDSALLSLSIALHQVSLSLNLGLSL